MEINIKNHSGKEKDKKRTICGIKPTGELHIGNYFGAIKQLLALQETTDCFYFIADYHALTITPKREELIENSYNIAAAYIALGLDSEKSTIFMQSSITELCELSWILSCVTPFPLLQRAHAYKSSIDNNTVISHGTFTYPVLMAADILMYDIDYVAVGKDQKQHIEMARDIAEKFNMQYGDTFKLPEAKILEHTATVAGIDGRKMSKSYNNTIKLFGPINEIKKAIMAIVTDSKTVEEPKDPDSCNIFNIYRLFLNKDEEAKLKSRYINGNLGYGTIKKELLEITTVFFNDARIRHADLLNHKDYLREILKKGSEKAELVADKKMKAVKNLLGIGII